jgi:hypothetical protein
MKRPVGKYKLIIVEGREINYFKNQRDLIDDLAEPKDVEVRYINERIVVIVDDEGINYAFKVPKRSEWQEAYVGERLRVVLDVQDLINSGKTVKYGKVRIVTRYGITDSVGSEKSAGTNSGGVEFTDLDYIDGGDKRWFYRDSSIITEALNECYRISDNIHSYLHDKYGHKDPTPEQVRDFFDIVLRFADISKIYPKD